MRLVWRPGKMLSCQKNDPGKKPSRAYSIRSFTVLEEDMFKQTILAGALALTASTVLAQATLAQEVKVGVALPYTGIGAELAQQVDRGIEQYLKLNANAVRPYKITLVKRDVKDPGGANARTVVQELLTQDNVDALAGWVYSPNAIAAAPVVSAGKKLAVIMNAGTAHITQNTKLQDMGPAAVGLITMHHYNADLDNPENKRFVEAWKKEYGANSTTDFMAVGGYDGMAAIVHAVQATKGKLDSDAALNSLKGWKFNSPRGPIMIDPDTRDIVMNEYLSEVIMKDGRLAQKVIGKIDNVKDACKAQKIAPCT